MAEKRGRDDATGGDGLKRARNEPSDAVTQHLTLLGLPPTATLADVNAAEAEARAAMQEGAGEVGLDDDVAEGSGGGGGGLAQEQAIAERGEARKEATRRWQMKRTIFEKVKLELAALGRTGKGDAAAAPAAKRKASSGRGAGAGVGDSDSSDDSDEEEEGGAAAGGARASSSSSSSDSDSDSDSSSSSSSESGSDAAFGARKKGGKRGGKKPMRKVGKKTLARKARARASSEEEEGGGGDEEEEEEDDDDDGDVPVGEEILQPRKRKARIVYSDDEGVELSRAVKYSKKVQRAAMKKFGGGSEEVGMSGMTHLKGIKDGHKSGGRGGGRSGRAGDDGIMSDDEEDEFGAPARGEGVLHHLLGDGGAGGAGGAGGGVGSPSAQPLLSGGLLSLLVNTTPNMKDATVEDANKIRLTREQALAHLDRPYFKQLAMGCFVKVPKVYNEGEAPSKDDLDNNRATNYRVCRVHAVVTTSRIYDPWISDGGATKALHARRQTLIDAATAARFTHTVLHLAIGSSTTVANDKGDIKPPRARLLEIFRLSNSRITQLEWDEYIARCAANVKAAARAAEAVTRGTKDAANKAAAEETGMVVSGRGGAGKGGSKKKSAAAAIDTAALFSSASDSLPKKADVTAKQEEVKRLVLGVSFGDAEVERALRKKEELLVKQLKGMPNITYVRTKYAQELASCELEAEELKKQKPPLAIPQPGGAGVSDEVKKADKAYRDKVNAIKLRLRSAKAIVDAVDLEDERRRKQAAANTAAKANSAHAGVASQAIKGGGTKKGVSGLSAQVNERFEVANAVRMRAAADDERAEQVGGVDGGGEDDESSNPFARRRTMPIIMWQTAAGGKATAAAAAAATTTAAAAAGGGAGAGAGAGAASPEAGGAGGLDGAFGIDSALGLGGSGTWGLMDDADLARDLAAELRSKGAAVPATRTPSSGGGGATSATTVAAAGSGTLSLAAFRARKAAAEANAAASAAAVTAAAEAEAATNAAAAAEAEAAVKADAEAAAMFDAAE